MIKFFRKIRQKLLSENKLSKYLLYAIGEIVLVVIGILIALWINNLNMSSQKKAKGNIMLSEIRENLISDTLLITEISVFYVEKQNAINTFLQVSAEPKPSMEQYNELGIIINDGSLFSNKRFQANNAGYSTLSSSGNIELITNIALRNKLTQYYQQTSQGFAALEELVNLTRSFKYYILPKLINAQTVKQSIGLDFEIQTLGEVRLNDDKKMLSDLLILTSYVKENEQALRLFKKEIIHLLKLIDEELKK
ncbi:DUF6090 family protein [Algibacter sp.]|uniref:DUF6090 family protein n=1 Tax=Algibacter sp. TaxID=1872428 RepID=UPI003C7617A5